MSLAARCESLRKLEEAAVEVSQKDVERLREVAVASGSNQMESLEPLQRGSLHQTVEEKRNWHQAVA